jgi:hypothetical protein
MERPAIANGIRYNFVSGDSPFVLAPLMKKASDFWNGRLTTW